MLLICKKCLYEWDYTGKRFKATCPKCCSTCFTPEYYKLNINFRIKK